MAKYLRSNWRTVGIGNGELTDKKIERYKASGYYERRKGAFVSIAGRLVYRPEGLDSRRRQAG